MQTTPIFEQLATEPLTTASIPWRNEMFVIGDSEIIATLSYEDRPLAVLGSGLFNQREFVIDLVRTSSGLRTKMGAIEISPLRRTDCQPIYVASPSAAVHYRKRLAAMFSRRPRTL